MANFNKVVIKCGSVIRAEDWETVPSGTPPSVVTLGFPNTNSFPGRVKALDRDLPKSAWWENLKHRDVRRRNGSRAANIIVCFIQSTDNCSLGKVLDNFKLKC